MTELADQSCMTAVLTNSCMQVNVDASNVPAQYGVHSFFCCCYVATLPCLTCPLTMRHAAISILSQCMSFPQTLVFFVKGHLSVSATLVACNCLTSASRPACMLTSPCSAAQLCCHVSALGFECQSLAAPYHLASFLHSCDAGLSRVWHLQARLPFTKQAIIAPLDLYWLINCNGSSQPDRGSWLAAGMAWQV